MFKRKMLNKNWISLQKIPFSVVILFFDIVLHQNNESDGSSDRLLFGTV